MQVTSIQQFDEASLALTQAREGLVGGVAKTGDLVVGYAREMCNMYDQVDVVGERVVAWFDLKGKDKVGVKAERALFAKSMQEAGFEKGTVDVYWQRVKEASGYITAGNRAKTSLDVDSLTFKDLATISNRILAHDQLDGSAEKSNKIKGLLIEAYEGMGGDAAMLKN